MVKSWRQFENIEIDFHKHLTILTGANGAGKTTILNILSYCFGWNSKFVSSYIENNNDGKYCYTNNLFKKIIDSFTNFDIQKSDKELCGKIEFSNSLRAGIYIPKIVDEGNYDAYIEGTDEKIICYVRGVYIDSHRPVFPYRKLSEISTIVSSRSEMYASYNEFKRSYIFDEHRDRSKISSTLLIKKSLASLAVFGDGNDDVIKNCEAKKLFDEYVNILKVVLPPKLGFEKIQVAIPEVLLCTKTGNFPIDAVSGGISSIIDITWQLFMYADVNEEFIAIIDEPENHLHPELQKTFLSNLIKAFPNVQFIVATHNPFIITSEKDSAVYVLDYDENGKVNSKQLDYVNKASTSNEILKNVLGIDTSMPLWAENELNNIIKKYSKQKITSKMLDSLRNELMELGLGKYIPDSVVNVIDDGAKE